MNNILPLPSVQRISILHSALYRASSICCNYLLRSNSFNGMLSVKLIRVSGLTEVLGVFQSVSFYVKDLAYL